MIWDRINNYRGYRATPIMFALILLILFGTFSLFSSWRKSNAPKTLSVLAFKDTSQGNTSLDSDHDGLKDWEEQIYGTDPHNPDTDGDGTTDGDEIAQGRDPLKPGPNDRLTKTTISLAPPASSVQDDGSKPNLTQQLAEVFGRDYLTQLVKNPQDQPDVNAFADKMAQITLEQTPSDISLITANDLIISHHATKDDILRYLTQFDTILSNQFKSLAGQKSISDDITDIVHTDNAILSSAAADQLGEQVNAYNQFLANIKTISVPEDFISLHVDYLNTAIKEREALKKIQGVQKDPVAALVGLREYMETTSAFNDLQRQYTELAQGKSIAMTTQ